MKKLTLLFLFIGQLSFAQSELLTKTINNIEIQEDTIRSVFDWVTDNIKYDIKKAQSQSNRNRKSNGENFSSRTEKETHMLNTVMSKKKGVCEDYALLFRSILSELGFEAVTITGFTKNGKGKINTKIGHAWNAVYVNGNWKLYDLTWAAGYIVNDKKFVKKYNEKWFDTSPEEMIKSHMPYDPIWQLSSNPLSYEEFEKKKSAVHIEGEEFDFNTLISEHLDKEKREQIEDELSRSQKMGDGNRLVAKWQKLKMNGLEGYEMKDKGVNFEAANAKAKTASIYLNEYIDAKNNRFKGEKYSKEQALQKLLSAKDTMNLAMSMFENSKMDNRKIKSIINKSKKQGEKMLKKIEQELSFLESLN